MKPILAALAALVVIVILVMALPSGTPGPSTRPTPTRAATEVPRATEALPDAPTSPPEATLPPADANFPVPGDNIFQQSILFDEDGWLVLRGTYFFNMESVAFQDIIIGNSFLPDGFNSLTIGQLGKTSHSNLQIVPGVQVFEKGTDGKPGKPLFKFVPHQDTNTLDVILEKPVQIFSAKTYGTTFQPTDKSWWVQNVDDTAVLNELARNIDIRSHANGCASEDAYSHMSLRNDQGQTAFEAGQAKLPLMIAAIVSSAYTGQGANGQPIIVPKINVIIPPAPCEVIPDLQPPVDISVDD